jgi:hypothetical protein
LNLPFFKKLQFSNLGFVSAQGELEMAMIRRLKLIDYLKKVPEILNIPIRSPIIVTGMGRYYS